MMVATAKTIRPSTARKAMLPLSRSSQEQASLRLHSTGQIRTSSSSDVNIMRRRPPRAVILPVHASEDEATVRERHPQSQSFRIMLRNVAGLVTRSGGTTRRPSRKAPAGGAPDLAATPASRESPPKRRPVAIVIDFHIIETMKSNDAIDTLGALASEARLAVYRLLVRRG